MRVSSQIARIVQVCYFFLPFSLADSSECHRTVQLGSKDTHTISFPEPGYKPEFDIISNTYPPNAECTWNITAVDSSFFYLRFTKFELDSTAPYLYRLANGTECNEDVDFMEVRTVASEPDHEKHRFCGYALNVTSMIPEMKVNDSSATVYVKTDSSNPSFLGNLGGFVFEAFVCHKWTKNVADSVGYRGRAYIRCKDSDTPDPGRPLSYDCNKSIEEIGGKDWPRCLSRNFCDLRLIPNAYFVNRAERQFFDEAEIVTIACKHGYVLDGHPELSCKNGQWISEGNYFPLCAINACFSYKVSNGKISNPADLDADRYKNGSSVTVECNKGYILLGNPNLICNSQSWQKVGPEWPICIKNGCGSYPVKNGKVSIITNIQAEENRSNFYADGTVLIISCNRAYKVWGNDTVFCKNHMWVTTNGDLPFCKLLGCPSFPVQNGVLDEKSVVAENLHERGKNVKIICDADHIPENADSVKCGRRGEWSLSNRFPRCIVDGCESPAVRNAEFVSKPTILGSYYRNGHHLKISCLEDFVLIGDSELYCDARQWVVHRGSYPACIPKECPQLRIKDGIVYSDDPSAIPNREWYQENDTVNVQCKTGFELQGSTVLACVNRQWKAPEGVPICARGVPPSGRPVPERSSNPSTVTETASIVYKPFAIALLVLFFFSVLVLVTMLLVFGFKCKWVHDDAPTKDQGVFSSSKPMDKQTGVLELQPSASKSKFATVLEA